MDPKGRRWHQNWGQGERILVHLYFIIILYLLLQRMPPKQELDLVDICQHVFVQHGNTPYIWKSQGGGLGTSEGRGGKPWVLPPLLPLPTVYCNPVEVNHIFLNLERMGHGLRDRQKLVTVRVKSGVQQHGSKCPGGQHPTCRRWPCGYVQDVCPVWLFLSGSWVWPLLHSCPPPVFYTWTILLNYLRSF